MVEVASPPDCLKYTSTVPLLGPPPGAGAVVHQRAGNFLGYAGPVIIDWPGMGVSMMLALGGVVAGTGLVRHLPQERLRRLFGLVLIAVATSMLIKR